MVLGFVVSHKDGMGRTFSRKVRHAIRSLILKPEDWRRPGPRLNVKITLKLVVNKRCKNSGVPQRKERTFCNGLFRR